MLTERTYDEQYIDLLKELLRDGEWSSNRTGINTLFKIGHYMGIDCEHEFPLLTTKRVYWKSAFAEILGFIRGYDSAKDFRSIGCKVWDQNANENDQWLNNPNRNGTDSLGRIYGVQWRRWYDPQTNQSIDQLKKVVDDLSNGIDDRREIITAWNPAELDLMALPPCHFTMIFSLSENKSKLNLSLIIRSNDVFLGNPFNIAQYAFLLNVIAKITKKRVGVLHYFCSNVHIYRNHLDQVKEQLTRSPKGNRPWINISNKVDSLEFLENTDEPIENWANVINYDPHPPIKASMAV